MMAVIRQTRSKWYAALVNGQSHIHYGKWNEFKPIVHGKSGAKYKGFEHEIDARRWLSSTSGTRVQSSSSFTFPRVPTSDRLEHLSLPGQLNVYTDGSHIERVGAGWAFVVVEDDKEQFNDSGPVKGEQTNNRGELTAILMALESVTASKFTIWTDSQYSRKCVTEWYLNWKQNGWITSTGYPVKNVDLIERIIAHLERRPDIQIKHIPAHRGHKWNEKADQLAKRSYHAT
jgi:ribonuclease HI